MAKGLNYLGRAIGAAGVVLPALLELKDEMDADVRMQIARSNRDNVRSQYNDEANSFVQRCMEGVERFDKEFVQPKLDAINSDLAALSKDEMQRSIQRTNLEKLRDDCSNLIRRIHQKHEGMKV